MASRGIDFLITYRVVKLMVTPFEKQPAYALGIIDKNGKVLKKAKTLKTGKEREAYTLLHRFVFNLKRIMNKEGLGSRLGSFAVALALSKSITFAISSFIVVWSSGCSEIELSEQLSDRLDKLDLVLTCNKGV